MSHDALMRLLMRASMTEPGASTFTDNSTPMQPTHRIFGFIEEGDLNQTEFNQVMGAGWQYTSSIRHKGRTIFHVAMHDNRVSIVRALIAAGLNDSTEVMGDDGWNYAHVLGCYAKGNLLRELPMPTLPTAVRPGTKCPMTMAIVNQNLEGIQTLYDLDPRPADEKVAFMVHKTIKENERSVLIWLIGRFPQALSVRYHDHAPLATACACKAIRIVGLLLQMGCPASDATTAIYKHDRTALQYARRSLSACNFDCFTALLSLFPDDMPRILAHRTPSLEATSMAHTK